MGRCTGQARFDAPDGSYGVCHCGLDDAAAFVETILIRYRSRFDDDQQCIALFDRYGLALYD